MNKELYNLIVSDKIVVVMDDYSHNSTRKYKNFNKYLNSLDDKNNFNCNIINKVISIPNKNGKIYFVTTSSLEKIQNLSIDEYFYNGEDKNIISYLKNRIKSN